MDNGQSKPLEIITPPTIRDAFVLTCHRFFAPVVFPEPDKIDPRRASITPRLGNFPCIREKCTMWNADAGECFDVTAAKGLALLGQRAYGQMNDALINQGE